MVEEVKKPASETKPGLFGQLKLPLERDISFHPSAPMYVTDRLWLLPTDCSSAAFHWARARKLQTSVWPMRLFSLCVDSMTHKSTPTTEANSRAISALLTTV